MSAAKKTGYWLIGLVIILGILAVLWAFNKTPSSPPKTPNPPTADHIHIPVEAPETNSPSSIALESSASVRLKDILNSKEPRGWGPIFTSWYGQPIEDFILSDIHGKKHKLSDYRGKDVLIVFWATWCIPCIQEIPHLIALRNIISEEKLAILAISNEDPVLLKRFTAGSKINYTILSGRLSSLPSPLKLVMGIPSSFFVDKEGKIKLATQGILHLADIKLILQAE
jgi:peroxiredoxin